MGCSKPKEVDLELGADPDSRIADTLAYVRKTLVEAPYGWKAYVTTEYSGGYGFYMQFGEDDRVKMVADLTDQSSSEVKESTYRIRQIMAATLSFDTYTYLTMLQDPDPSVFGGERGKGMGSDVEYDYVKTHGDTLFFEGRKFYKPLVLVKAKKAESEGYVNGAYKTAINKFNTLLSNFKNPYVIIDDKNLAITVDEKGKSTTAFGIDGKGVQESSANYYYTLEGLNIEGRLLIFDKEIQKMMIKGDKLFVVDTTGKEYEIKDSNVPVLPLKFTIGTGYKNFFIDYQKIYPGTIGVGAEVLGRFWEYMPLSESQAPEGRKRYWFNPAQVTMRFQESNETLYFDFKVWQGTNNWTDTYKFNYIRNDDNSLTFNRSGNGTINYVDLDFAEWSSYIDKQTFDVEYYEANGHVYAKFSSRASVPFIFTTIIL